jgi:hypothetical protein
MSITSKFPLYELIQTRLKDRTLTDLPDDEKKKLAASIRGLDQAGREAIFMLCYIHECITKNKGEPQEKIPYNSELMKTGIKMNLIDLPTEVQYILLEFLAISGKN